MKYKVFLTRFINLIFIVGLLLGYQSVLAFRAQSEQIAYLENELDYYQRKEQMELEQSQANQNFSESQTTSGYQDGTYTGSAEGFGGNIEVSVTIESGKITDIQIVSAEQEDTAYLEMAVDIVDAMLEAQSDDVDTISGATFSSTGIKNAVHEALEEAGQ